jgi:hypothetical protein
MRNRAEMIADDVGAYQPIAEAACSPLHIRQVGDGRTLSLIWLGILMGFGPEISGRFHAHAPPFPAVVYFHAVVFVGWLCLLTAQVLLIRFRRAEFHRELGMAGTALYGAMIVLGVTTSVVVDNHFFGKAPSVPSFLSIQLADMISFAVLGGAAIALRKNPVPTNA